MSKPNKYGLGRTIAEGIKREVRRRCGFGCVRCGLGFYDYEHFAPDFKDAVEHHPAGITLLCMQCNQKRARGLLSAETVAQANANPICLQEGFTREEWGFGHNPIEVAFAGVTFTDVPTLIKIKDKAILSIAPPEEGSGFYQLSGLFTDEAERTVLEIRNNEWFAKADNWDVECVGNRIMVRRGPRDIVLVLRSEPPHRLVIEKLNMRYGGYFLRADENILRISRDNLNWNEIFSGSMISCPVGIWLM